MRKVVVDEWMSLDGVVQAPGNSQEDTTGGFQHGGWHMRYFGDDGSLRSLARRQPGNEDGRDPRHVLDGGWQVDKASLGDGAAFSPRSRAR